MGRRPDADPEGVPPPRDRPSGGGSLHPWMQTLLDADFPVGRPFLYADPIEAAPVPPCGQNDLRSVMNRFCCSNLTD